MSLIHKSQEECDITVCSIFVNPTQFNDPADLARYPRTPEIDTKMLEKQGCDALFIPKTDEIYPKSSKSDLRLGPIVGVLEGEHRPGHFEGVAQVVRRFFEIVRPHRAYFGSKDYQQTLVIRHLVKLLDFPIEVIACPIVREPDGLAMSSRNALLNTEERLAAGKINGIMMTAAGIALNDGITAAKIYVNKTIDAQKLLRLDYFEVCDKVTLQVLDAPQPGAILLIAVYAGKIRLIDNLPLSAST